MTLTPTTLGKFCREIAAGLSPLPILLAEWGVSQAEYERIRTSDGYQQEMRVIVAEMQELGADAGYIYRMKSLSEEFITDIVEIMRSPNTSAATKVDLIKFCADLARLKEKPLPTGKDVAQAPRGPSVVFNFGAGLPLGRVEMTEVQEIVEVREDVLELREPTTRPVQRAGFAIIPD